MPVDLLQLKGRQPIDLLQLKGRQPIDLFEAKRKSVNGLYNIPPEPQPLPPPTQQEQLAKESTDYGFNVLTGTANEAGKDLLNLGRKTFEPIVAPPYQMSRMVTDPIGEAIRQRTWEATKQIPGKIENNLVDMGLGMGESMGRPLGFSGYDAFRESWATDPYGSALGIAPIVAPIIARGVGEVSARLPKKEPVISTEARQAYTAGIQEIGQTLKNIPDEVRPKQARTVAGLREQMRSALFKNDIATINSIVADFREGQVIPTTQQPKPILNIPSQIPQQQQQEVDLPKGETPLIPQQGIAVTPPRTRRMPGGIRKPVDLLAPQGEPVIEQLPQPKVITPPVEQPTPSIIKSFFGEQAAPPKGISSPSAVSPPAIQAEMLQVAQTENIFKQVKKITSAIKIDKGFLDHFDRTEVRPIAQKSPGLFSTKKGMPLDEVADGLGISTDELAKKLRDAVSKKEETESLKKQIEEYRPPTEMVTVGELRLNPGDKFKIPGEQYQVTQRNEEGHLVIKDGITYEVDEFDKIPIPDEGTLKKGKPKFVQPKMFEGEKVDIKPTLDTEVAGQGKLFGTPSGEAEAGGYAQTEKLDKLKQSLVNNQYDPSIPLSHYQQLGKPQYVAVAPGTPTQDAFRKLRTLLIDNRKGMDELGGHTIKSDADYLNRNLSHRKPPTGTAEAGGYTPTKEQTQYAGADRQAQELPEVVELYNEISKGKYPAIERYMKDKLGYFSPRKDKIGLRQDLPVGERLDLSPHVAGLMEYLSGDLDLQLRKGDLQVTHDTISVSPRVFGKVLSTFEMYMREASGLTEEQIAFKKDFNRKTRMYELRAYRRDKTIALKVLAHEVFHYIDYLPDHAKRGNALGHIATLKKYLNHMLDAFPVSEEESIHARKVELKQQAMEESKGKPEFWRAVNIRYKELLKAELEQREVITKKEILAELKALTQKIKPFNDQANPKYTKYRYSNKELYADAGGALLWNPELLQETAPKFYKSFFAYLERKPDVKQVYDGIQNKLGRIPGLRRDVIIQDRIRRMEEGRGRGRKARKEMEERQKVAPETIIDTLLTHIIDDEHPNLKPIRKLEKGSESDYAIGRKARLSIEELKMIDSKIENYINHFTKKIDIEMKNSGITLDELDNYAQAIRVVEERGKLDIFNPGGETLESSKEMLAHLEQSWGAEKYAKVSGIFDEFQNLRKRYVIKALEESKRYDPELIDYAKKNLFYTRNSVVKYLTERFGGQITGNIYKQYGSLSEIESPIEATVLQDLMLIRAAKVNELKLDMVDVLRQTKEITPAEIDKSTTHWEPKPPPNSNNYAVFTVMRDGKPEHYYVDKQIVETFKFEPYKAKQIAAVVHIVSEPFRRLYVTRNPRWMFKNPIRDIKSTIKQLPEIKLRNVPEFMMDYGRGVKESFSDVFLGKRSEDVSRLMEGSGLIAGRYYDQDNFETKIQEIQSRFSLEHHPKKVQGAWNRLKRVAQIIDHQFDKAGRVSDMSTKVAGYKYLKKHSAKSEREIMHDVRTLVGSPNARRRGRLGWLLDNMFTFSNMGKEGLRSSWEAYRAHPTAYLWKTTALSIMPLLTLMGAGAAGVEWVKKILEELSQYDLESKTIIPTPYTVNGKPVAIGVPEDYQGIVVRKLVFNIMNRDVGGTLKALWDAKPYQWHPLIKIGNAMFQYYMMGNNPEDTFRNREIIPRTAYDAGGWPANKALLKHTWNELGGSLFYRFPYDDIKQDFKSIETLKSTFPMNALGDFLIISDSGIRQSSYKIQDRMNQQYARKRYDIDERIKKSMNSGEKTNDKILRELYVPMVREKLIDRNATSANEFIKKYRRMESGKEHNQYLDSLESAGRNEVKKELLREYSKKMSQESFRELILKARRSGILSDNVIREYRALRFKDAQPPSLIENAM